MKQAGCLRTARRMRALLFHFKQLNSIQFPRAANLRQNEDCGTGMVGSKLSRLHRNIDSHLIRAERFGPEHARLPQFRLSADYLLHKSLELARTNHWHSLILPLAAKCGVELGHESLNRFVDRRCCGRRRLCLDSSGTRVETRGVLGIGARCFAEKSGGFFRLAAPERNLAQSN